MYYKSMNETKRQDPSTFIDYLKAGDRRGERDNLGNTWLQRYSRVNRDDQGNRIPTDRIVEALILYGVDVTAVNTAGDTALHLAVQNNINICRLLIQNGANVNAVNNKGKTPLHCAAQHDGNVESICNLLINNNAAVFFSLSRIILRLFLLVAAIVALVFLKCSLLVLQPEPPQARVNVVHRIFGRSRLSVDASGQRKRSSFQEILSPHR